jgi:hypothetical protein
MSNSFQDLSGELVRSVEDIKLRRNTLLQELKD